MAQKRMFSREITDSDSFLDLSLSAQCLYFHACLSADDEGFISAGKRIARSIGATERELDELVESGFLILFPESGVYVAAHFWVNNTLRSDRFHETVYQTERKQLELNENKVYQLRKPNGNQTETSGQPDDTADKDSIDKSKREKEKIDKKSIDDNSVREGSSEGGDGLLSEDDPETIQTMRLMFQMAGITADGEKALSQYGLNVAHDAFVAWKQNGSVIGKYNEFLKGVLENGKSAK